MDPRVDLGRRGAATVDLAVDPAHVGRMASIWRLADSRSNGAGITDAMRPSGVMKNWVGSAVDAVLAEHVAVESAATV